MNIKNLYLKTFFYRQHPDAALRYLPIVELIKARHWENGNILEVGSGSYGITPYLQKKVVGVDISFDEPEFPFLKRISGSATNLPFEDNKFDVVILSDVIEHLSEKFRKKALTEAVRVGKLAVVVNGPFGFKAAAQDKKLAEYSQKKLGKMHKFFKDHLKFGLPEIDDVGKYLKGNLKVQNIKVIGYYLNLKVRNWMMKFFISKNKLSYYFYLKGLMIFIPILKRLNQKPCYRTLILIKL